MLDENEELSPSQLNDALRLAAVAKTCGPQFLDDPKRFNQMFRWNRFASLDGVVLGLVRRMVEAPAD